MKKQASITVTNMVINEAFETLDLALGLGSPYRNRSLADKYCAPLNSIHFIAHTRYCTVISFLFERE